MRGRPVGMGEARRLVSFRLSVEEIAQLEELSFLVANRQHADGFLGYKQSKTAAMAMAVATLLVQFKRAAEDARLYQAADEKPFGDGVPVVKNVRRMKTRKTASK